MYIYLEYIYILKYKLKMYKYIVYYLGLYIPYNITPLGENAFHVSLLCLIILTCFINVFGYFLVYI